MVEWQSTLSYLKNPPKGYGDEGVDLQKGLDDIGDKVSKSNYDNEYDFENDIAKLLIKAHDGHLTFSGMTQSGVFTWRRDRGIALISAAEDGKGSPKIWGLQDFNQTQSTSYKRSAVSKIDGKDATEFVRDESLGTSYHDPDSRYNSMFYMQPAENFGFFANPRFYPGAKNTLTFENGTSQDFTNSAVVMNPIAWVNVKDGKDFYNAFVVPRSQGGKKTSENLKRSLPHTVPHESDYPREAELSRRWVPWAYPTAVVEHSSSSVKLAGYFVDGPDGKVGVLMAQTFNVQAGDGKNAEALEYQSVVQKYIEQAKKEKISKHIIDVRTNGGGKIMLGYDMFLQFFPEEEPQLNARWRGHKASELIGEKLSSIEKMNETNGNLFTAPFNYHSYITNDEKDFTSFKDMYPPEKFHDDTFTKLLRYNLSSPIETTDATFSIGIEMTGYMNRSNFEEAPFKAEDLVILTDGICASTCSLFVEAMTQQAGVKTLAVGGYPGTGPMQAVGGTKGSMLLPYDYLIDTSATVVSQYSKDMGEIREWRDFLPQAFGIAVNNAGVNFQDTIRHGLEKDGIPTQFLNDTASCRIYYEPNMYLNVSSLWSKAAEVAFGKDGGMDEGKCVAGSVTSKDEQTGKGEGNPDTGSGSNNNGDSDSGSKDNGNGNGNGDKGTGTSNSPGTPSPSSSQGAAAGVVMPAHSGWGAVLACGSVVLGSMLLGGNLL